MRASGGFPVSGKVPYYCERWATLLPKMSCKVFETQLRRSGDSGRLFTRIMSEIAADGQWPGLDNRKFSRFAKCIEKKFIGVG